MFVMVMQETEIYMLILLKSINGGLEQKFKKGIREIFELTKQLGGSSGEHGIGLVQKDFWILFLKRNTKRNQTFDPRNILTQVKYFKIIQILKIKLHIKSKSIFKVF